MSQLAKVKGNVANGWYMAKRSDIIHFMKDNHWLCQPDKNPDYIYYRYNESELEGEEVCSKCKSGKSKR